MTTLLERLKGAPNDAEIAPEIPDVIPSEWADMPQDPPPGQRRAPKQRLRQATTAGAVTPALRKRIGAEIEAYVEFAALPLVMRDPVCGGALHEQARPIADALTSIISRYPDLAHKFLATGVFGDWLKLGAALQPVLAAVWQHHVRAPREEEKGEQLDPAAFPPYRPGQ